MADDPMLDDTIAEFLFQMSANGRRPSSVASYGRELALLGRDLASLPVTGITAHDVSRFLASPPARLRRDGSERAVSTRNRTRAVVRAFFAWCHGTRRIADNPAFFVSGSAHWVPVGTRHSLHDTARGRPLPRRHPTLAPSARAAGPRDVLDHRLHRLRLSELTRMDWGDLDVHRRCLVLRSVKGGGIDTRHVSRRLLRILAEHRRVARDRRMDDAHIFGATGREALSPRTVQYRFAFWLARSGIRRRMSVHSLRHTFATLLYSATGDLLLVSRALGHRDIRTTQRYAHVEEHRLAQR
jgi:integrase/recombinase XerC